MSRETSEWQCPLCVGLNTGYVERWTEWDLHLAALAHARVFHEVIVVSPLKDTFDQEAFDRELVYITMKRTFAA